MAVPVSDRQEKGDVIYRQDAIDVVSESMRQNHHQDGKEACCHEYEHRHFLYILYKLPSAQKKGHWVENQDSDHAWKCSECGCGYTDSKLSFCYDCGADMRGDANEDT